MLFSLLVKDVDLAITTQTGLIGVRDKVWKAAITEAIAEVKTRAVDPPAIRKCIYLVNALASREAAREADRRFKFKSVESNLLNIYIVLVVNGMTRRMSDAVIAKLAFLPRFNMRALWSTTAVQDAAHVMSGVFRQLNLCSCTWMHSLPVVVVAAVVETFVRHPEANDLSWWLVRKKCRKVWQRAIQLCGPKEEEAVEKRVRAAFLMLVMVLRAAKKFPDSDKINSDDFPLKNMSGDDGEGPPRDRIYMSEREVRSLIVVLTEAGMTAAGKELTATLDFQCAVARSAGATDNKDITQWCSYSAEEETTIVTCASSLVLNVSQVVKSLAKLAENLKQNSQFTKLVTALSADGKDFAYPFLLSMLLVKGSMSLTDEISVTSCCECISDRISDEGEIAPVKPGSKQGTKRRKYRSRSVQIDEEIMEPSRKKRATAEGDEPNVSEKEPDEEEAGVKESGRKQQSKKQARKLAQPKRNRQNHMTNGEYQTAGNGEKCGEGEGKENEGGEQGAGGKGDTGVEDGGETGSMNKAVASDGNGMDGVVEKAQAEENENEGGEEDGGGKGETGVEDGGQTGSMNKAVASNGNGRDGDVEKAATGTESERRGPGRWKQVGIGREGEKGEKKKRRRKKKKKKKRVVERDGEAEDADRDERSGEAEDGDSEKQGEGDGEMCVAGGKRKVQVVGMKRGQGGETRDEKDADGGEKKESLTDSESELE